MKNLDAVVRLHFTVFDIDIDTLFRLEMLTDGQSCCDVTLDHSLNSPLPCRPRLL